MKILGFIETSLVDWDKKVASVIFLGGCNFHCPFCQNYPLASESKKLKELQWQYIKEKLIAKKKWIDGVVVSGGEPMMHPEIFELLINIKELGFLTKVDTNGFYPYPLQEAIERNLVDYIAMDIKTNLNHITDYDPNNPAQKYYHLLISDKYNKACGRIIYLIVIERTIKLLKECGKDYEFRTTLVPGIADLTDIPAIAQKLAPAKKYVLQQFVPANARLKKYRKLKPYTKTEVEKILPGLKQYFDEVKLRGF